MYPPEQHRGPYYDPTSSVQMHRRITLLPEKISEETRLFLKCTYDNQCLLENLSTDEANAILIKASPSEAQVDNQPSIQTPGRGKENFMQPPSSAGPNSSTPVSNTPIQAIMVYPPPPAKGGIPINTEDYGCLGEDNFLNDVIIDFYLKYFVQTQLSPEEQHRTHVFSSFFYKRLTTKSPPRADDKQSAAERRHNRVRSWTKHVDLFSKDFIIIPINENSHWFLGVVCFPGLTNAVRMSDGKTFVPNPSKRRESGVPQMIGGTTITRVNQEPMTITIEPDEEDRDEADAEDDDLEPNTSDDEPCEEAEEGSELLDDATHPVPKLKVKKEPQEPIKQPCILIFDSLAGASRSKVCATLREYLQVEYNVRHRHSRGKRDINKVTMKASVVKVPQQTNYTDCGLYVLQYTEAFFQNPITDYRMPIKQLVDWFDTTIVSKKRYQIQQLLHKLMDEQNVDTSRLTLPALNLHPEGTGKVFHDDEEEEMPEDIDDMDYEDMEEDDEMMGEEEEDEEMAEFHRKIPNPSITANTPMIGNTPVPTVNSQVTQGEDIRARIQRSIASSIGSSVSITTSTSTTAPSPVKTIPQPVTPALPGTPLVPPTISLSRKIVQDSSPTKTPQHTPHSKFEHLSITSTTVGSSGAKRKVTSVSLKDVRNPRLSQTPTTPNRSVDIKKVRNE
uniref:Ubiquitin-like protease family profile domain-containing protein n=2 Tax=Lygus hesperus TaxID=30085 RepID=A0A0K8T4P9_LYGHE